MERPEQRPNLDERMNAYEKPATPADELDHDELLIRVKDWFLEDGPHCRKWHTVAKEDFAFRSGEQTPEADKAALESQGRPCIEFNKVDAIIDAVVGAEITNRQEVRYLPRQTSDAPANEVLTEAARWFRDECDAEHEESHAFADCVTCGMGWTETRLDYEENPDGDPSIDRIDPLEMFWDCAARSANLTDSRRVYRVRRKVPIEEVEARWPGRSDYDATWASSDSEDNEIYDATRPRYQRDKPMEEGDENEFVTLVQVQWYERETYYRSMIIDPVTRQKQDLELSKDEHMRTQERAASMGLLYRGVRQVRKCYYEAFIGGKVLEATKMVAPSGTPATFFKFVPITGKFDRNKGHFYGLVKGMKGPQQFANRMLNITVEIMARSAKGGLMLEEGAVTDSEEFDENWAKLAGNSYFKPGAIAGGKIQPKPIVELPAGHFQMMQYAIQAIRDVPGVNAEILGQADANQPASLEYQRRQSATVILAPFFDSLRRYRRIEGRGLLFLITEYLMDERLVRIVGQDGEQYVPLIKDPNVTKYDVIVDDAPSSPSQKELVWNSLIQVMPLVTSLQPPPEAILALLDYSPIPASVVAKIKQAVQQAQQNQKPVPTPTELKAQEIQLEMQRDQQKGAMDIQNTQQTNALEYQHKERLVQLDLYGKMQEYTLKANERAEEMAVKQEAARREAFERDERHTKAMQPILASISPALAGSVKELAGPLKNLADMQGNVLMGVQAMHADMRKPRKRTLFKGKDGRASHAIEEIIDAQQNAQAAQNNGSRRPQR